MSALGLIETKGLIGAIEAADAMVKAADVRILEKHHIGGGLVTVTIGGEVSAVRASVDAAIASIGRIDGAEMISTHVIARPYDDVSNIIAIEPKGSELTTENDSVAESPLAPSSPPLATDSKVAKSSETVEPQIHQDENRPARSELQTMPVGKLRQLAEGLDAISLSKQAIRKATKKKLIEAILNVTDR